MRVRVNNLILLANFLIASTTWYIILAVAEAKGIYFSIPTINKIMYTTAFLGFFGCFVYFLVPKESRRVSSHILFVLHILVIIGVLFFFWLRAGIEATMNSFI